MSTPTLVETVKAAAAVYLSVWSRSRFGEWLIERSYPEPYVRNVLRIPAGAGRVGDDGRFYIALPQGVHPSPLIEHPAAACALVRRAS